MNDSEIDDRFPGPFPPYLRKKIAHRLLHPVALGSPGFFFITALLYVMMDDPENPQSAWQSVTRLDMSEADPETINRCKHVIQETIDRLRRHTERLILRMMRALDVLDPSISIPPYMYDRKPSINRKAAKLSYKRLLHRISNVLYQQDPMGISAGGESEYDLEARTILPRLTSADSEDDVRRIVGEEFVRWFGSSEISSSQIATIAAQVWTLWQTEGSPIKELVRRPAPPTE